MHFLFSPALSLSSSVRFREPLRSTFRSLPQQVGEFATLINSIGHKLTGYRTAYDDERGLSHPGTSDCDVDCFYSGESASEGEGRFRGV